MSRFRVEEVFHIRSRGAFALVRDLGSGDFIVTRSCRLGGVRLQEFLDIPRKRTHHGDQDFQALVLQLADSADMPRLSVGDVVDLEERTSNGGSPVVGSWSGCSPAELIAVLPGKESCRLSISHYPPGASFSGSCRQCTLYCLSGRCRVELELGAVNLGTRQCLEVPKGDYSFEVLGGEDCAIAMAFDLERVVRESSA